MVSGLRDLLLLFEACIVAKQSGEYAEKINCVSTISIWHLLTSITKSSQTRDLASWMLRPQPISCDSTPCRVVSLVGFQQSHALRGMVDCKDFQQHRKFTF